MGGKVKRRQLHLGRGREYRKLIVPVPHARQKEKRSWTSLSWTKPIAEMKASTYFETIPEKEVKEEDPTIRFKEDLWIC